jgi:hypothetical protein
MLYMCHDIEWGSAVQKNNGAELAKRSLFLLRREDLEEYPAHSAELVVVRKLERKGAGCAIS